MQSSAPSQQGFSLIELMIVVAIIGILAAIAIPQYGDYVRRGKVTEATATLAEYRTRLEQYYQDNRNYGLAPACGVLTSAFTGLKYFSLTCETKVTGAAPGRAAGADDAQTYRIVATGLSDITCYQFLVTAQNLRAFSNDSGANFSDGWNQNPANC